MGKLTKKAEILEQLHSLVTKQAEAAQTNISGEPGKDTKVTSISESTENTDKNAVGPEKLNDKQKYEQKPASDPCEPVASPVKSAADIDSLANDILATLQLKMAEAAQTNISGEPGKDTKVTSISESTENTDKNAVGPEKLNDKQKYEQKPASDPCEPVASPVKSAAEKQASYDLGRTFCELLIKKAEELQKTASAQETEELLKLAGRRDLDTIIEQATAKFANEQAAEKQAQFEEQQGAIAFDLLHKQAQLEQAWQDNQAMAQKLAEYAEYEKQAAQQEQARAKEEETTKIAAAVAAILKHELSAKVPQ